MSYVLQTHQLSKAYTKLEVISNVNMKLQKGEIYGFLGPNGAGKTTIMRMLTNLIKPTSGSIELFGEALTPNSYEVFKRIGSIIEYPIFYEHMTAQANMELHLDYMGVYNKKVINEALELVQLTNIDKKPVMHYSLGMKQRLGIARAISTRPELLILDEPTNGLDPLGIHQLRDLFHTLCKEYGMTLLISSHILQEIEQLADTIGILNHGKLVEEVSMETVRSQPSEYIEIVTTDSKHAAFVLEDKLGVRNFKVMDERTIRIYQTKASSIDISRELILNQVGIEAMSKKNTSLEEHFLKLIQAGGGIDD